MPPRSKSETTTTTADAAAPAAATTFAAAAANNNNYNENYNHNKIPLHWYQMTHKDLKHYGLVKISNNLKNWSKKIMVYFTEKKMARKMSKKKKAVNF